MILEALIISRLDTMAIHCYIISPSLTNRLQRIQNSAARLVTRTRKREHITRFIPAPLASSTSQITPQDPVSYIQSTEWNSNTTSKRSDRKLYTTENASIRVLFILESTKSHTGMNGGKSFRSSAPRLWNKLPNKFKLASSRHIL